MLLPGPSKSGPPGAVYVGDVRTDGVGSCLRAPSCRHAVSEKELGFLKLPELAEALGTLVYEVLKVFELDWCQVRIFLVTKCGNVFRSTVFDHKRL